MEDTWREVYCGVYEYHPTYWWAPVEVWDTAEGAGACEAPRGWVTWGRIALCRQWAPWPGKELQVEQPEGWRVRYRNASWESVTLRERHHWHDGLAPRERVWQPYTGAELPEAALDSLQEALGHDWHPDPLLDMDAPAPIREVWPEQPPAAWERSCWRVDLVGRKSGHVVKVLLVGDETKLGPDAYQRLTLPRWLGAVNEQFRTFHLLDGWETPQVASVGELVFHAYCEVWSRWPLLLSAEQPHPLASLEGRVRTRYELRVGAEWRPRTEHALNGGFWGDFKCPVAGFTLQDLLGLSFRSSRPGGKWQGIPVPDHAWLQELMRMLQLTPEQMEGELALAAIQEGG